MRKTEFTAVCFVASAPESERALSVRVKYYYLVNQDLFDG